MDQDKTAIICTIDGAKYPSFTDDTMFGNSSASCHIRNSDKGTYEIEAINESIVGIVNDVRATKKGKLQILIKQADGTSTIKVSLVKFCVRAKENLFSFTQELSKGAKLDSDNANNITLNYSDGSKITFDWRIKTRNGCVGGVDVVPIINNVANLSQDETKDKPIKSSAKEKTININEYHCALLQRRSGKEI